MGSALNAKDLIMVGSVPLETAEDVFAWVAGSGLGEHMAFVPDGEPGERSYWITGQGYRAFNGHPDVETISRPDRIDGVENWKPRRAAADQWSFRVRDGVDRVRFGDPGWRLGYARDAISSYFVFKTLKARGLLVPTMRFQVCLPMPVSTCIVMFREHPEDFAKVIPGYTEALAAEARKIAEIIDPADLVIQWDSTAEATCLKDPRLSRLTAAAVEQLSAAVHRDALLGFHLCHGSLPANSFFMRRPDDLAVLVEAMNAMLGLSARKVDFIHFPIVDHAGASYYAPLRGLKVDRTRWYLGCIHGMDDEADFRARLSHARRYIAEFGIGAPCGYGRFDPDRVRSIADDHLKALEIFHEKRK
jgi:hypothetical protein